MRKETAKKFLSQANPRLASEWDAERNPGLSPKSVTSGSNRRIWWRCDSSHRWQATVCSRNRGSGCPYCSGQRVSIERSLAVRDPHLASEWHPERNGRLKPEDVLPHSHRKVWWLGGCGHEWLATVASRSDGSSCPFCAGVRVCPENSLASRNPELAKEWHPHLNGKLTPEDVTSGSRREVWWQCEAGHEWRARIYSRNAGSGCPYCAGVRYSYDDSLGADAPEVASQWNPVRNGNLSPWDVPTETDRKIWWRCREGHEWRDRVENRTLLHHSCPQCNK